MRIEESLYDNNSFDEFRYPFPVYLTAKKKVTGIWYYTFKEQTTDPDTGDWIDADIPRKADRDDLQLREWNDIELNIPTYALAMFVGFVGSLPLFRCWEATPGSSGRSPATSASSSASSTIPHCNTLPCSTSINVVTSVSCVNGQLVFSYITLCLPPNVIVCQT